MATRKAERRCRNCQATCRNCGDGTAAVNVSVFRNENSKPIEVQANAVAANGVGTRDRNSQRELGWLVIRSGPGMEATLYFHDFEDARQLARQILTKVDAAEATLAPGSCPSDGCQVPYAAHEHNHIHRQFPPRSGNGQGSASS